MPARPLDKVVDGNAGTKYLTFNVAPLWIQWQCNTPQVLGVYSIISANDDAGRDPRNWTVEASNNGTDWTVLDTQLDQIFPSRLMTKLYFIPNTTAYTYYRLNVSAHNGATLFQLGEWGLYEVFCTRCTQRAAGKLFGWKRGSPVVDGQYAGGIRLRD